MCKLGSRRIPWGFGWGEGGGWYLSILARVRSYSTSRWTTHIHHPTSIPSHPYALVCFCFIPSGFRLQFVESRLLPLPLPRGPSSVRPSIDSLIHSFTSKKPPRQARRTPRRPPSHPCRRCRCLYPYRRRQQHWHYWRQQQQHRRRTSP